MNPSKKTIRILGVLYLLLIVFGIFGQVVRSTLIVPTDAAATARNLMGSELLVRFGFVSDLLMTTCYFLWGLALYFVLKPVNKSVALLMAVINFVGAPIMALNMLNQFAALQLLGGAEYLKAIPANQLQTLALFFLNLQNYGYLVAAISFGLYLLPLGYLVLKSGYFPKVFGVLYMGLGVLTLLDFFTQFLFPRFGNISEMLLYPAALVEFGFCAWLLIKGANLEVWKERILEADTTAG